jgi:hypothetical protein
MGLLGKCAGECSPPPASGLGFGLSNRVGLRLWSLLADEELEFMEDKGRHADQPGVVESGQSSRTDERLNLAANSLRATWTAGEDRGDGACHGMNKWHNVNAVT